VATQGVHLLDPKSPAGLVEQIVKQPRAATLEGSKTLINSEKVSSEAASDDVDSATTQRRLARKLRIQIFAGTAVGLLIALCIGAAFLCVAVSVL
jgi:high-affinity iron transporter